MKSPFYRSMRIASLIAAALSLGSSLAIRAALAEVPEYYSRGKGRGGWHKTSGIGQRWKCNNAGVDRPHQNRWEMARRVRQGLATSETA